MVRSTFDRSLWIILVFDGLCFQGVGRGRPTISLPSVGRLSIQCEILNISQPYGPSGLLRG
jgi:hypothetical protein